MRKIVTLTSLAVLLIAGASHATEANTATEAFFDSDGVSIRYITKGQGEPMVLIHGFTASAEMNWVMPGIFDKLAEAFQVIAIDARGHGKSGKPHDPAAYGDLMVEDVVRLLDHMEIEKAHIGGYSMGGFLTMRMLAIHPERMLSATIGAAGWSREGDPTTEMDELAESLDRGEGIAPLLRALTPADQPPPTPEVIAATNAMVVGANDQKALAAVIRGMNQLTVTEMQLRRNEVPAIAIIGSRDPLKAGVDAMAPVMKNLEVKIIDGGDHMTTLLNPAYSSQFSDAVLGFLVALCKCA